MLKQLLEESKEQLTNPLGDARRRLLIVLNVVYLVLLTTFLISAKIYNGEFVPDPILLPVYGLAVFFNLVSLIYNIRVIKKIAPFGGGKLAGVLEKKRALLD